MLALAFALGASGFLACDNDSDAENAAEEVGEAAEDAGEKVEDALD
jgi:hypothetical protein